MESVPHYFKCRRNEKAAESDQFVTVKIAKVFGYGVRLAIPVLGFAIILLAGLDGLAYQLDDKSLTQSFGQHTDASLTLGHICLPFLFLAVSLTCRSLAAMGAILQCVFGAILALWLQNEQIIGHFVKAPMYSTAFGLALSFALASQIYVYDQTRGRMWWRAPLLSGLTASLVFIAIYYPLATGNLDAALFFQMSVDLAVKGVTLYLGIGIFFLLRPIVPNATGYGGA